MVEQAQKNKRFIYEQKKENFFKNQAMQRFQNHTLY